MSLRLKRILKEVLLWGQELSYSFHLGSDKNKSKVAKKVAKGNTSGTTSLSNNAIQNANDLSGINKHNLRDYDNERELIRTICGTDNIVNDVKNLYLEEFETSRIEYNNKQTRNDRKIDNYFEKVCSSPNDIACEIIIELGDMDFWQDKDNDYRFKMVDVFTEQIADLNVIVPSFKIANATIHFDESSPHMHIVGIPVIENCNRGMKKQVGKTKLFTKESLAEIQDKMRFACIKSYNKIYNDEMRLKEKQKGRNKDINVRDMKDYKVIKQNYEKHNLKLKKANEQTEKVYKSSNNIKNLLETLKPAIMNKNNNIISNEAINKIKDFIEEVQENTKTMTSVNDLNIVIREFESSYAEIGKENDSLKYQLDKKDNEIKYLKDEIFAKDKIINKLQTEKEKIKEELQKFKNFWHNLMTRFHNKITFDKDEQYKYVSDDLHKAGVLSDDDFEIATNALRKVKPKEEIQEKEQKKKDSDRWMIKK